MKPKTSISNPKTIFVLSLSFCILLFSCNKGKHFPYDGPCHCGVDNPLEELEWLHNAAVMFSESPQWASISICTYDSVRQGFIINPCVNCPDGMQSLVDCAGNGIGALGGFAGIPLSTYNIDPASVREIYRNYPDTAATLAEKRWQLQLFFNRETNTGEVPLRGNETISFWLCFHNNGQVEGGGVNILNGSYTLHERGRININIAAATEIYDATGWEERMLNALNDATICYVSYYGETMRIYYDMNRKYMDFVRAD